MTIKRIFAARLRTFFKADRGNIAMMFALSLIPLMIGAGAGLDFARGMLVRQQMAEALDAAALAVGSTTGLTHDTAQALAQKYFDANYTVDKTDYGTPTITIPGSGFDSKGSVTVTATDSMPTVLVKLIGINTLPITTSSNVVWGQTNLWVALVLDNSGSMTNGDTSGSKMSALKSAITGTNGLLSILQNATSGGGEAKVSIVPFVNTVNVGTANAGASWIDWQNWECQPQKVSDGYDCKDPIQVSDAVYSGQPLYAFGPGDSCPFTSSYFCAPSATNDGSCTAYKDGNGNRVGDCVDNIPSTGSYSGYICPSMHIANSSGGVNWHYYNGCWVPAGSTTVINTGSSANCNGYTSTTCGCVYSPGTTFFGIAAKTYACIINPTILGTGSSATCDGHSTSSNCGCVTSPNGGIFNIPAGTNVCLAKVWNLTWTANNHSSWGGCVRDRWQNYDIANTTPSSAIQHSQFQAVNNYYCSSAVTPLTNVWTTLSAQVNAMVANGATNQAIGMAHGWQTLTPGDPYGPGDVPDNTTRYIILFSDGLNTMARWYGDGGTEGTTLDGYIDAREKATCDAAKADGIVIYAIYVSIGNTSGNSAPLQYCASDATKYYTLTSTTAITTTFQQISNLRVVK